MEYNTILLVDDEEDNLALLYRTFRTRYNVLKTTSPLEAIKLVKENDISIVISDHKMPEMDGIELLQNIQQYDPEIIRILVTAFSDASILIESINKAQIYQYVKKPFNPHELSVIVERAIDYRQLRENNQILINDLKELFSGTITAIIEALDAKDSFTLGRSRRVTFYSLKMADKLNLSDDEKVKIELAGLLHDIGMIGVSDDILYKIEKLTPEEFEEIKRHVDHGVRILNDIKQLKEVVEIIKYHHEKYDGTGYPAGLSGDSIPLGARIIAIADTFDSMISNRAYRGAMSFEEAQEKIKQLSNSQFDPNLVEVFIQALPEMIAEVKKFEKRRFLSAS